VDPFAAALLTGLRCFPLARGIDLFKIVGPKFQLAPTSFSFSASSVAAEDAAFSKNRAALRRSVPGSSIPNKRNHNAYGSVQNGFNECECVALYELKTPGGS
jgi:hypothetical protein